MRIHKLAFIVFIAVFAIACRSSLEPASRQSSPINGTLERARKPGTVSLILKNTSDEFLVCDISGLPSSSLIQGGFDIETANGAAVYTGYFVSPVNEFNGPNVIIAPGASYSVVVDLDRFYTPRPSEGARVVYETLIGVRECQSLSEAQKVQRKANDGRIRFRSEGFRTNSLVLPRR